MLLVGNGVLARTAARAARPVSACAACQSIRLAHKLVEVDLRADVEGLGAAGDRVVVAPGRARQLYPFKALYVMASSGASVSPMRDLVAKQRARELRRQGLEASVRNAKVEPVAQLSEPAVDHHAVAIEAERTLFYALGLVAPLRFHRRLLPAVPGQPSLEIFGSVAAGDVVKALRETGVVVDETMGAFEDAPGVEGRRIKAIGSYTFTVNLKLIGETVQVPVEVTKE